MTAIHIHRRIDSETLHLPELRPFLGQDVEIVVTPAQPHSSKKLGSQCRRVAQPQQDIRRRPHQRRLFPRATTAHTLSESLYYAG